MTARSICASLVPLVGLAVGLFTCSTGDPSPTALRLPDTPGSETSAPSDKGCEVEGVVRECSEITGARQNVLSCLRGVQECRDGVWGPCGGDRITFVSRQIPSTIAADEVRKAISKMHSPVPKRCTVDPCNPDCLSFDERPETPVTSPFQPGFSYEGNPNEWGNAPQGFINKQNCGDHGPGCWSGYPKDCGGAPTHYNRFDGCQADHHCDETTDKCIRSKAGWTWPVSVCDGVDLTIGPSCSNGTNIGFPLCNRGNAELPAGTQIRIAIRNGNSYDFTCPRITSGNSCNIRTTAPLRPGECMRIVRDPSCNWSGNTVAYVNADKSIAECGISQDVSNASQPGCSNNWSDITTGAVCETYTEYNFEPTVMTEEYTAVCPTGTRPSWSLLVYEATTPCSPGACDGTNASSVQFEMQTAPSEDPEAWTSWVTVAHAPSPPFTHPSACTSSGPGPCPVQLGSILPDARHEHLRLKVTVSPSPDGQAGASLAKWEIAYDCGARE